MAGIVSIGTYIPWLRLGPKTRGWSGRNERAVANFDEDAVTMAVAAIRDCLLESDKSAVAGLYFASSSAPYAEKLASSIAAVAADLGDEVVTADVAHSTRAGTLALRMGLDAVRAGSLSRVMVVASDARLGAPLSADEQFGGDAAVALLLGEGDEILRVMGMYSLNQEIHDTWRADGERTLRSAEDRFAYEYGYLPMVQRAVGGLLQQTGLGLKDFEGILLTAPDVRRHTAAVRRIGADAARVQPPLLDSLGNAGAAFVPMQLAAALDTAKPGQRFLLVNYGNGADALALEVTDRIADYQRAPHRGVSRQLAAKQPMNDYLDYLRWRELVNLGEALPRTAPAPHALFREQDEVLRFHGARCLNCGMVQFPPQRVCVRCQAKDRFEPVRMAEGGGTLFSYSKDFVAGTRDVPLIHAVVDFEAGGRAMMMVTDRDPDAIRIGMPLEPTFRKLFAADGIHNYYWKMAPRRLTVGAATAGQHAAD